MNDQQRLAADETVVGQRLTSQRCAELCADAFALCAVDAIEADLVSVRCEPGSPARHNFGLGSGAGAR